MKEKILKKKYYKITFKPDSPLAIGSGENDYTDKDLVRDANGRPYIPASAIAGVVRESLSAWDNEKTEKYMDKVNIAINKERSEQMESKVIFYDANITDGTPYVSVRDSVALDEFKTAKKGAKFDMEVLEPGVTFTTFLEQDFETALDEDYCKEITNVFLNNGLVFGGKGTRGYGKIKDVCVKEKLFSFPEETRQWLKFDPFMASETEWNVCDVVAHSGKHHEIRIELVQKGGISIRRYTTKPAKEGKPEPDMEQLTLNDGTPVIPGTTWAGAIRHRMEEFGITEGENSIFGYVKSESSKSKASSKIVFGESELKGCTEKILSRNAIDRFSGGTVDGALFTEKTYYNGACELVISWK